MTEQKPCPAEGVSIDSLKSKEGVTNFQLDTRVEEVDLPEVASCFDNTVDYVEKFQLSPGQQTDVRTQALLSGTHAGMKVALKYWRNRNPVEATFRTLLLILLSLLKGDVAVRVCKYLSDKSEESRDTPYSSSSSLNTDNALKRSNSDSNVSTDSGALLNDSDLDSVNVLCKCPCGNTDFKHCIQPPPDCLDKGYPEMHLSIGEDTKKAQNCMEQQLVLDTKILKDEEFVSFGIAVRAFAKSLPNGECILKTVLQLKKKEIISSSFDELFGQIINDADFFNYEPIKSILKACISECLATGHAKTELQLAAEDALEKYEEAFQKYAQHRVYAIASHVLELSTTSTKDMHTQLKIKVEEEFKKFPIERIKYFQHCIEKILRLPEETQMRVILVREGCVELTFQLIGLAGDLPFPLSIDQKRELASWRISMLEYAGEVEYCCCELFEDEIGKGMVIEMYEEVCQRDFQCDDMDDNQEDDATNSDGYFEMMAANNPGTELDAFNKLKLHTSKNVGSENQKKFCDRSVSPFRHEPDEIASPVPLMAANNPGPELDAFSTPFTSKNVGTDDRKNLHDLSASLLNEKDMLKEQKAADMEGFKRRHRELLLRRAQFIKRRKKWYKHHGSVHSIRSHSAFILHSKDTDTDLEEQYETCAACMDPRSRERPLSQDDQVHHSYFQAPGHPPSHSPPSVLRHSNRRLELDDFSTIENVRRICRRKSNVSSILSLLNKEKEQSKLVLFQAKERFLQELSKGVTVTPNVGRGNGQPDTQLLAQLPFPVYKVAPGQQLPRQAQVATFPRNNRPNYGDSEGSLPLRLEDPPHMQSHSEGGVPNSLLRSQHHGGAQYQRPSLCSRGLLPATVKEEVLKSDKYIGAVTQENSTQIPFSGSQSAFPLLINFKVVKAALEIQVPFSRSVFPLHSRDTDTDLEEQYELCAADNVLKRSNSDSDVSADSGALSNDSDLDSVNKLCKCPCGNTDFKHCIQPPPDCLDKGFAEMHLSIGEDTKKAQNYMEQQLALDTKTMRDEEFVHFGMAVHAFALSTPNREFILKKILKLKEKEIISSSFDELYDQITEDADFINYEPIKIILKECTSVCLETGLAKTELQLAAEVALKKYEEAFQKYAQHRVYAIGSHLPELSTTSTKDICTQLKIKVEEEFRTFPIERINYFRHCVRKTLRLPEETQLRVTLVREGCVELTFQLIGLAGDSLFKLSIEQKRELASQRISMLEYAGEVKYCYYELFEDEMAAINPRPELDAFNKLHTSKNHVYVVTDCRKNLHELSVSLLNEKDMLKEQSAAVVEDSKPLVGKIKLLHEDTDTDLKEQYEPCAACMDPRSRERPLSQDDQVHHSYFQAPGHPPPHSPPSVLRHSDHGSARVRSSATLPHLPQNGYSDSRASCATNSKLERPLSQEDQVHHGYQGIDSRTQGRASFSAAKLHKRSRLILFEGAERYYDYSRTANNESGKFSGQGFDTGSQAFRMNAPSIPPREAPSPLSEGTNLPIPPQNIPHVPPREHSSSLPTLPCDVPLTPLQAAIGHKPIACSIDPSSQTQGSNSPEIPEQSELPFFLGSSEPGSSSPALSHLAYEDSSASPHASPRSSVHGHDAIYETTQSHDISDLLPGGGARVGKASGTSSPIILNRKDQLHSQSGQLSHKSFPRFTKHYEIPETLPPIHKSRNLASTKDSKAASPQSGKQTSSIPIPLSRKWQVLSPSCQSVSTVSPKPKPRSKLTRTQSDAALLKQSLPTAGFRTSDHEEPLPTHERKSKESVLEVGLTREIAEMNKTSDSRKQQTNEQTPFDSNLTCPVCGKMFRMFETLKCGSHVRKCQEKHEEKKQWNERVRGSSGSFSPHQSEHEVSDPRQVNSSTDSQCDVLKSNGLSFNEDTPRPIPKRRNKV